MNILLAVTGSIAAYKVPSIASVLVDKGYNVKVMMTRAAEQFVTPLSLSTMSKNSVFTEDIWFANDGCVHHIELALWTDIIAVIPATYNTISKILQKIADNLITSTIAALSPNKKLLIFPAMNVNMWSNLGIKNVGSFDKQNRIIYEPASGKQACENPGLGKLLPTPGLGKLLPTKKIIEYIEREL